MTSYPADVVGVELGNPLMSFSLVHEKTFHIQRNLHYQQEQSIKVGQMHIRDRWASWNVVFLAAITSTSAEKFTTIGIRGLGRPDENVITSLFVFIC